MSGAAIEYKYAIFVGGRFDRWEAIGYNRRIRADELAQNTDINMQGRLRRTRTRSPAAHDQRRAGGTLDEPRPAPDAHAHGVAGVNRRALHAAHVGPLRQLEQEVRIR